MMFIMSNVRKNWHQTYLRFGLGHPVWIHILEESNLKETKKRKEKKIRGRKVKEIKRLFCDSLST